MDFSFFTTDNKSGYKTNYKWFSKNYPQKYNDIIKYCESLNINDLNFKEKVWLYFNQLKERPKCLTCNKEVKFRNRFDKPYGDFCTIECANENKVEMLKRQKTSINKKYGVDYYPQHKDFISKQRNTKLLKYGDENFNNVNKSKKTRGLKYGDDNYNNHLKYKETCMSKYGDDNYSKTNNYKNKIINNFKSLYPNVNFVDINKWVVIIKCDKCGNESEVSKQLLYERYKRNYDICTTCNPIGNRNRGGYEIELVDMLNEMGIKCETNIKLPDKKTEIDILLTDHNIGLEINGLYWHNELFKSNDYHLKKTIDSDNIGIKLIHIFEDEWVYKKDIIISILKNKIGLVDKKIYARKCEIREIKSNESKEFLEQNHIQGNVNSKVRLALFYDDKMVSLMTFSKGRVIMGGKSTEWELNRFCNLIGINVIGGASKLMNYFIKNYSPKKIISYSDIRLFDGGMYERLGFKKVSISKPNYWYVINDVRKHRFTFRKSILTKEGYDPNQTEREIMFNRKIYRIYDCGNVRWEFDIH